MAPKILLDGEKCAGCGLCAEVCKRAVLEVAGDGGISGGRAVTVVRPELCVRCGLCVALCPAKALAIRK